MSAFHAASTKTPIASILLVIEITGLPNLIIPIILANISAYVVSGHRSLYDGQIRSRDVSILKQLSEYDQFSDMIVEEIMTSDENLIFGNTSMELEAILEIAHESGKKTFPILEDDIVVGIISVGDIERGINTGLQIVDEAMTEDVKTVTKDMTARQAMLIILNDDVERVPVVDDNNKIQGILTMSDILRGQQKLTNSQ